MSVGPLEPGGADELVDHEHAVGFDELGEPRQAGVEVVEMVQRLETEEYVVAFPFGGHPVDVGDAEAQDVGETVLGGGAGGEVDALRRHVHARQEGEGAGLRPEKLVAAGAAPEGQAAQTGAWREVLGGHVLGK
ncbi:hypothetical protein QA861_27265 [Streptomyces sp. B21-083]